MIVWPANREETDGEKIGPVGPGSPNGWPRPRSRLWRPALAIVDPHHHLWLRNGYTYLLPELADDLAGGHNIAATVFAECHSMYRQDGPEAERSLGDGLYDEPRPGAPRQIGDDAIAEAVRLTLEETPPDATHWSLRWLGWRGRIRNVAPAAHMLADERVRDAVAVLDRMGLSLDCWLYHPQLDEVADLADAFPDLTIILNHVGSPILGGPYRGKTQEVFEDWAPRIRRIAERQNIAVKLGALPIRMPGFEGDRTLAPGSQEVAAAWRPWIESCIESFGPYRAMFESNFPVQKRWCSYQICWNAFKRLAKGASASEKRDLFAVAAMRAYRMERVAKN